MSTRASYTFKDERSEVHVFVHHDGYPSGAAEKFHKTLNSGLIWPLPRFEADEFACGFIAANKDGPGSIRIIPAKDTFGDIEFSYDIFMRGEILMVIANEVVGESEATGELIMETLYAYTMEGFIANNSELIERT